MNKKILSTLVISITIVMAIVVYAFVSNGTNTNTSSCIITIDGSKYNVTAFRTIHKGGDIFQCDKDMTQMYNSQHGINYNLILRYKV